MGKNNKTQKMSRTRVAPLRKQKLLREMKKNPGGVASMMYRKSVINCTIPPVSSDKIVQISCPWDEKKTLPGTAWNCEWNAGKWYKDMRSKAYAKIKEDSKKYKCAGKRKAWYLLDRRKRWINVGTEEEPKWKRTKSEYQEMYDRTVVAPITRQKYWELLANHKLEKQIRKNPAPIPPVKDKNNPDMFEAQDMEKYLAKLAEWEKWRDETLAHLRDVVISMYDKLPIMGNRVDTKNAKMKADKIAEVKDSDGKGHDVTHPNLSTEDKLYKEANKKAQEAMNKDGSIIDADLVNHKRNQKRPLNAKRAKTVTLADKKVKKAA